MKQICLTVVMVLVLSAAARAEKVDTSPMQSYMMRSGASYLTLTAEDQVSLLEVESAKVMRIFKINDSSVHAFAVSSDERILAIAASGGVSVFNLADGRTISKMSVKEYIYDIGLSSDGRSCVIGTYGNGASVFNAETGELRINIGSVASADSVAINPDGSKAAIAKTVVNEDGKLEDIVQVFDTSNGKQVGETIEGRTPVFSLDGCVLAVSASDQKDAARDITMLDVTTLKASHKVAYTARMDRGYRPMKKIRAVEGGFIYVTSTDRWKSHIKGFFLDANTGQTEQVWSKPMSVDSELTGADFLPKGEVAVVTDWQYNTKKISL